MAENDACCATEASDLAGNLRTLFANWGVPSLAMLATAWATPGVRGLVWVSALLWMGAACFMNARRCGRTHCRYTWPFLVVMAGLIALEALGALPLGASGWLWLGVMTLIGFALIWWGSEHMIGRFRGTKWPQPKTSRSEE